MLLAGWKTWMGKTPALGVVAALAFLALTSGAPARAAYEFGAIALDTSPIAFSYLDKTTFGSFAANDQVSFSFSAATGLSTQAHAATLTISGSTNTPGTRSGQEITQPINQVSTLDLTDNATGKKLLELSFTGSIAGTVTGANATLSGSDASGNTVTFSSDYLNFSQPGNSFSLALDNLSLPLIIGPGGFIDDFTSQLVGSFTGNATAIAPSVPEPASLVLLALGLGSAGLVGHRARRTPTA